MFKRKALEKLKNWKEKGTKVFCAFGGGQACWKSDNCRRIYKAGV